ncbi:MAG: C_GCAxxG_C_C family protein [Bacteroidales bacterium]|nr:C_GCAxxG_C_C family protein [Bacteroidales bacterium]
MDNCAQAVVCTYCDLVGLPEETALDIAGAYGTGMGNMEGTCGANTVDKVFDETGKALDGIDVSHLSADDESALESKIEEKVSATMKLFAQTFLQRLPSAVAQAMAR